MLKLRITYRHKTELDEAIKLLKENFEVMNVSKIYKNTRKNSKFKRIYISLENKNHR